jgi:hypothetical protein
MRRRIFVYVGSFIVSFFLSGFLAHAVLASHGGHVVIAEVQIGGENAKDEFVEVYNPTATAIPLEGWRLSKRTSSGNESNLLTSFPQMSIAPHQSVLIVHPDGIFAVQADATYSTTQSLSSNNTAVLYSPIVDGERPVVDLVGWGSATSFEGTVVPELAASQSLERKPGGADGNGTDTDNNAANFVLQSTPTPQPASASVRPALEIVDDSGNGGDNESGDGSENQGTDGSGDAGAGGAISAPSPVFAAAPPVLHVRINEFVADPVDGEEWIELINIGPNPVNLADWIIEDGSETRTKLSGALGIGAARFAIVTKPKGNLNNAGDRIVLYNPHGNLVDSVTYGDWDDGRVGDNAPAAPDPASVARVSDGVDTDNDRADFVRTEVPTPGSENVVSALPAALAENVGIAPVDRRHGVVVLNELHPNPVGDDRVGEYIELINIGTQDADLSGWRIEDALGTTYEFDSTTIAAGEVLVIARSETGIALNNTGGEQVRLFTPGSDRATSLASYTGRAIEGSSWVRDDSGRWLWTIASSPGKVNVIEVPNRLPDAVADAPREVVIGEVVVFDGSDSADPDGERLSFLWDFGDDRTEADVHPDAVGRYVYDVPGTYVASLAVVDARGATSHAVRRVVVSDPVVSSSVEEGRATPRAIGGDAPSTQLVAASVLWGTIVLSEIVPNPEGSDSGEWIELAHSGDEPVALEGFILAVVSSAERTTVLPATLVIPANGFLLVSKEIFRHALRNDGATVELRAPDGGIVDSVRYDRAEEGMGFARRVDGSWSWTRSLTPGSENIITSTTVAGSDRGDGFVRIASLATLDDVDLREDVSVEGVVTIIPGAQARDRFYIADQDGGVQVYIGSRSIPELSLGDQVVVYGQLREATGELRVGIRDASDVVVVGNTSVPSAIPMRVNEASAMPLGAFVEVEGDVVEVRGRALYLDDGTEELRVTLPVAADADAALREGALIRVSGILAKTKSGFRVLAGSIGDVSVVAAAPPSQPLVPDRSESLPKEVELAVLSGGTLALLGSSLWRRRRVAIAAASGIWKIVRRLG